MLGSMISRIRKEKGITKVSLSKKTSINIGHLTHIEKGERNPSHKTLKSIAKSLDVPYKPLSCLYEEEITEETERCKMINHLTYNKILAIDSYSKFIECPSNIPNASVALKIKDDAMEPILLKNSYAFLELNVPIKNRDIALFEYNDNLIIRRFIIRKDKLVLRSENKKYEDIYLSEDDDFTIVGKILKN